MGRGIMRHPRAEVTATMNWEEDHISTCQHCERDIKRDWDGDMIWVPAYELPDLNMTKYCDAHAEAYGDDLYDPETEAVNEEYVHEGWDYDSDNWQNDFEFIKDYILELWPSLYEVDEWPYNEVHVFARNNLVEFSVCEYMGVTEISINPLDENEGYTYNTMGLAKHWIAQVEKKFLQTFDASARLEATTN